VECCVKANNLRRKDLIKNLNEFGQDMIFYGAPNFAKFHINTQDPEGVLTCASSFGEIRSKKIFRFSSDLTDEEKKSFCLAADSTCDLTEDLIEKNPIYFIPIKVQAGEETYTDRLDIIPNEFYKIMETASSLPKTSQPSLNEFVRIYKHLLMHYGSIISVHLSKALSGTFQTAVQASHNEGTERISVIDGNNISVGLGLVLLDGIRAIESGKNHEETAHRMAAAARNTQIFVGLPTLKFLVKGGRVTKTKGFVANVLNINPILSINKEGKLIPVSKARGIKNLEKKILDLVYQRKQTKPGGFTIAVAHTNAPDIGNRISERIKRAFALKNVMVMNASPVLGAHAGPGAYGIAIHNHSFISSDNNRNT
jgi:DegV family protein with EDD domain